jgi:UDPglucose 6-dehydrogenase
LPDVDVDAVVNAIGADSRVGSKCLKPGLGFGGPCFPRDNVAFQAAARDVGYTAHIAPAVVQVNREVIDRCVRLVEAFAQPGDRVAVLGVSYKADTYVVEESHGFAIAHRLSDKGYQVVVHDPLALDTCAQRLGDEVDYAQTPEDALNASVCAVFATAWPHYANLDMNDIRRLLRPGGAIVDCWRIFAKEGPASGNYIALGQWHG